jgi:hypothetical protein
MAVVDGSYGCPMKTEERATAFLAGGIMGNGYQCGLLWGAALAAGAEAYRRFGAGPLAEIEAMLAAERLVDAFVARNQYADCGDITRMVWRTALKGGFSAEAMKYILRGGPIGCFLMAAHYAPTARKQIEGAMIHHSTALPPTPVSCASALLRKMGTSEMHTVMAAGLAGGIGLSGGGCGALGAAIWVLEMQTRNDSDSATGFDNPGTEQMIERFLEASDYEFECSAIVGRRFTNVENHASYLHDGGCAQIIDALAAASAAPGH